MPFSVEPDPNRGDRCPAGSRGWSRAGSPCRPEGSRARSSSLRARSRTAARGRRRPTQTRARRRRSRACSTRLGACLLFETSNHCGSATPSASSALRSASRPPPNVFPVWATTATELRMALPRTRSAAPAARAAKSATSRAATPIAAPARESSGWCMPRYIRAVATKIGTASGENPAWHANPGISEAGGEHERQAAVDGDRGGGVAGRIARVGRQVLQPGDSGAGAMDDPGRDAVGRDLDDDRGDQEGRHAPATDAGKGHGDDADQGRDHHTAGDDRADQGCFGTGRAPVCGKPGHDPLVGAGDAAGVEQHSSEQEPDGDRRAQRAGDSQEPPREGRR